MLVQLDLNNTVFQRQWFALGKDEKLAVLNCCSQLSQMDWTTIYHDNGLNWEAILSRTDSAKGRLYYIRITKKTRAVVRRSGNFIEFLTLHPDHDSAYI